MSALEPDRQHAVAARAPRSRFSWSTFGSGALVGVIGGGVAVALALAMAPSTATAGDTRAGCAAGVMRFASTCIAESEPDEPDDLAQADGPTDDPSDDPACALPERGEGADLGNDEPPVCTYSESNFRQYVYTELYYEWMGAGGTSLQPERAQEKIRGWADQFLMQDGRQFAALGSWDLMQSARDPFIKARRELNIFWYHVLLMEQVEGYTDIVKRASMMYLMHGPADHSAQPVRRSYDEPAYLEQVRAALRQILHPMASDEGALQADREFSDSTLLALGKRLAATGTWDRMRLTRDKWIANAVENFTFDDATQADVARIFDAMAHAAAQHLLK